MGIINPVTPASIGAVPIERQLLAGTNVTIDGGASADLANDVTIAATGGGAFKGALLTNNVALSGVDYDPDTPIPWANEVYDTDGFHSGAAPTKIIIPAGVTKVRLSGQVNLANVAAGTDCFLAIRKNGTTLYAGAGLSMLDTSSTVPRFGVATAILDVALNDEFELWLLTVADSTIDIAALSSWFAIQVIA